MPTATAPSIVATVPFLSLQQVADQLKTTLVHILRLVARGRLRAIRAGDGIGDYRVMSEELGRYLNSGAPDFEAVAFDEKGWLKPAAHVDDVRDRLRIQFLDLLAEAAPEELPEELQRASRPEIRLKSPTPEIKALIAGRPNFGVAGLIRLKDTPEEEPHYDTAGEFYAAAELLGLVEFRAGEAAAKDFIGLTPVKALYASPEAYREIVSQSIDRFNESDIVAKRTYRGIPGDLNGKTLTIRLSREALGIDLARVAERTF